MCEDDDLRAMIMTFAGNDHGLNTLLNMWDEDNHRKLIMRSDPAGPLNTPLKLWLEVKLERKDVEKRLMAAAANRRLQEDSLAPADKSSTHCNCSGSRCGGD